MQDKYSIWLDLGFERTLSADHTWDAKAAKASVTRRVGIERLARARDTTLLAATPLSRTTLEGCTLSMSIIFLLRHPFQLPRLTLILWNCEAGYTKNLGRFDCPSLLRSARHRYGSTDGCRSETMHTCKESGPFSCPRATALYISRPRPDAEVFGPIYAHPSAWKSTVKSFLEPSNWSISRETPITMP